jgi:hypothetical protein
MTNTKIDTEVLAKIHAKCKYRVKDDEFHIAGKFDKGKIDSKTIDKVIKYSSNNNVCKIHDFVPVVDNSAHYICITKLYPDLMPMTIISQNCFYHEECFLEHAKNYGNFIKDFKRVSALYNEIVDAYIGFIKSTGCFFSDASGNNILVNSSFNRFKLIDFFSLRKISEHPEEISFSPLKIIVSEAWYNNDPKFEYFLEKTGVDKKEILENTIKKIETRTYKK